MVCEGSVWCVKAVYGVVCEGSVYEGSVWCVCEGSVWCGV